MDKQSPYTPPASNLGTNDAHTFQLVTASRWLRFANFIIDYFSFLGLVFITGFVITIIMGEQALDPLNDIPDQLIGFVLMSIYYISFEHFTGRSIGKLITGTKVVSETGNNLTFWQTTGRTLSRFIPFEPFSFFAGSGRGWHDRISRTYVIKCR